MASAGDVDWAGAADAQERNLVNRVGELNVTNEEDNGPANNEEEKPMPVAERSLLQKVLNRGLVDNKHKLEIERKNPKSPLYSVKSFEALNLKPELLKGVYAMGFSAPSKIQETALPTLLADPPQNMIAQSQSGTGKTAAFVLAMLSRVDTSKSHPQVLCLSPTYELALQTGEVASRMSQFAPDLTIRYAVRGEEIPRGSKVTEHIIIGTPGKVLDWSLKYRFFDLKKIIVFVLDEADVMIATQGHQDQSIRIHKNLSSECQVMLFSATYDKDVMDFAENIVPNPVIFRLRREQESLDNIHQYWLDCPTEQAKYHAISNIYGVITIGSAIIFCQTRKTASWLADKMTKDGHAVALLSGELSVEDRIKVLDRFRDSYEKILITTNVMARGIDVEQVTVVVNFDLPVDANGKADCETYLHRIGRTGRFGKVGFAFNMVDSPQSMQIMKHIEAHFGKPIKKLDANDVDELERIQQ